MSNKNLKKVIKKIKIGDVITIECDVFEKNEVCSNCGASQLKKEKFTGEVLSKFNAVTSKGLDNWQLTIQNKETGEWFRWCEDQGGLIQIEKIKNKK